MSHSLSGDATPPSRVPRRGRKASPVEPVAPLPWHSFRRLGLTPRESEVLWWIAKGKRDREIALILGLSHRTIHHHVRSILDKFGVETRSAAIAHLHRSITGKEE